MKKSSSSVNLSRFKPSLLYLFHALFLSILFSSKLADGQSAAILTLDVWTLSSQSTISFQITTGVTIQSQDCIKFIATNPYQINSQYYVPFSSTATCTVSQIFKVTESNVQLLQITSSQSASCTYIDQNTIQLNFAASSTSTTIVGSIKFLQNPFSQVNVDITVGYYVGCVPNGVSLSPKVSSLSQFQTGTLSNIQLSSSSNVIGQTGSTLTMKFKPNTILPPSGIISLTVPQWFQVGTSSTVYRVLGSGRTSVVSSQTSVLQIVGFGFLTPSTGTYTFSYQTTGASISSSTQVTLSFTNFRNPVNQSPLSGFQLTTQDDSANTIDTTTTAFSFSGVSVANTISGSQINPFQLFIAGTLTTDYSVAQTGRDLQLAFTVNLPLQQGCYVQIQFPSQIKIDIDTQINGYQGTGFMSTTNGNNIAKTPYSSNSNSNYIVFPSCTDTSQLGLLSQTGTVLFQSVTSPAEVITIGQFQIQVALDSAMKSLIATGTITPGVTMIGGSATLTSFTPAEDLSVQAFNSYTLVFSLASNLFSDSIIQIDLPSNLNTSGATSFQIISATNIRSDASISLSGQTITISNSFSNVSPYGFDSSIAGKSITLQISGAYNPYSQVAAGAWSLRTKNLVSGSYYPVDSGTASSSFTPTTSTLAAGPLGVQVVNPSTYLSNTFYNFNIAINKYLTTSSKVVLTLPSGLTIPGSIQCQLILPSNTVKSTSCSFTGQVVTVVLSSTVSASNVLVVGVKGIQNPANFKKSGQITIQTQDSSGNLIESGGGFYVSMTQMSQMTSFSVQMGNMTNGAKTNYNLVIASNYAFSPQDTLVLTFPSEVVLTSTVVNKCMNGNLALSCSITLQTVTIPNFTSVSTSKVTIQITNVNNPSSTRLSSPFTGIRTFFVDTDQNTYNSQQFTTTNVSVQTSLPATILVYNLTQDSLALNVPTQYTITFTPSNYISATGSIVLAYPPQVTIYSNVSCLITTSKTYTSNCQLNLQTSQIIFSGVFASPYKNQITITLNPVINPLDPRALNGFTIKTYDDQSQQIIIDVLGDNLLVPKYQCMFPCATCALNNMSSCQSCWQNQGLNFLMTYPGGQGTCKVACDTGYTRNGNSKSVCTACDSSCARCADNGLVGDKSICTTCATGYNYKFGTQCLKNCSGIYYQLNSTNCGLCSSPCATCVDQPSKCTSCLLSTGKPYLLMNQCVQQCPTGYIADGSQCVQCQAPCTTCVDFVSKCSGCDTQSQDKYLFGFNCLATCPQGTTVNDTKFTCDGCKSGCSICDTYNQNICLKCTTGLYLYDQGCVAACPDDYKVNFLETACVALPTYPVFPFPHLIAAAFVILVVVACYLKDRKSLIVTNLIAFLGVVEFVCYFIQIGLCFVFATYKFAALAFAAFFAYAVFNISFVIYFIFGIARRDPEFKNWRSVHCKTFWFITFLSGLLSLKLVRLFYSRLAGHSNFKGHFEQPGIFQKAIIYSTLLHIIACNGLMCVFDVAAFNTFKSGTQLYVNMIESACLSILIALLEIVEFFFLKRYLQDELAYFQVNHDSVMSVSEYPAPGNEDARIRSETLKTLMGKVKANQDLFLNNKLDDLFQRFGHRRCNSLMAADSLDKEEDPRRVRSQPISPSSQEFKFDKDAHTRDNVYTEAKLPDPVASIGKVFVDADTQIRPNEHEKMLKRKGGDFVNFDTDANRMRKDRKQRKRGRKNQYYSQIDAEDDEEVERDREGEGEEEGPEGEEDDLGVIREEDDEQQYENSKRIKKMQKQKAALVGDVSMNQGSPTKGQSPVAQEPKQQSVTPGQESASKMQQQLTTQPQATLESPEKIRDLEEEDTVLKEHEEAQRRAALAATSPLRNQTLESSANQLDMTAIGDPLRQPNGGFNDNGSEIGLNKQVLIEDSLKDFTNHHNLATDQSRNELSQSTLGGGLGTVQVPPDASLRNFNENDILGDFDRDEKGNVIVLQDESGQYVDKQARAVNERGYLVNKDTGDVIDAVGSRKMFDHEDIDERGELPAPFSVEKYNFNSFGIRGQFSLDKAGKPVMPQPNKQKELLDKNGGRVNKGGWLIDKQGNIIDYGGSKKFDKKQLVNDGQDLPKLFNYNGRRFDIMEICGTFDRDALGNPVFKSPKKQTSSKAPPSGAQKQQKTDNIGRQVNERGYLTNAQGNIINKEGKKIFDKSHLSKNGEFPKIFPFTKFNIKNVLGNFEMDPLGNPILEPCPEHPSLRLDRDGQLVNQRGYLVNSQGDVLDKRGRGTVMFPAQILDSEGDIPKVFRTGLLKSDTASSLSRLMSEIEKNQPFEEGNSDRLIQNELQRLQHSNPNVLGKAPTQSQDQKARAKGKVQHITRNDSQGTSLDSQMGDTPSNYNMANQRFDPTDRIRAQTQQTMIGGDNRSALQGAGRIDEVDGDSELGSDAQKAGLTQSGVDIARGKKRRSSRGEAKIYAYKEPSDKDVKMAKVYGGVARGPKQRIMPKAGNSNRLQTASSQERKLQSVAGQIVGYSQMDANRSTDRLENPKVGRFMKGAEVSSNGGGGGDQRSVNGGGTGQQAYQQYLNNSNEPSIMAVPEHHIREQRLKQRKMNELKKKNKIASRKKVGNGLDADFEKMFGKDIDEFLEDSDWDIESFGKMSNFSKGTARSALADGRIRGLESIYLQRIETSLKKPLPGVSKGTTKNKKKPPAFRVMQDRFIDESVAPGGMNEHASLQDLSRPNLGVAGGLSRNLLHQQHQQMSQQQPQHARQFEAALSTQNVNQRNELFTKAKKGPGGGFNNTEYNHEGSGVFPERKLNL